MKTLMRSWDNLTPWKICTRYIFLYQNQQNITFLASKLTKPNFSRSNIKCLPQKDALTVGPGRLKHYYKAIIFWYQNEQYLTFLHQIINFYWQCQIVLVPNCPGAKLSVAKLSSAKLSGAKLPGDKFSQDHFCWYAMASLLVYWLSWSKLSCPCWWESHYWLGW